jgi:hypothetical protein
VSDDEHDTPVEQRQPGDRELRVLARLIRPVAVKQCGGGKLKAGAVDDRDGHPHAVGSQRPVASLHVVVRAVVAEHCLLPEERALAGGEVDVVDAGRDGERHRADSQPRR